MSETLPSKSEETPPQTTRQLAIRGTLWSVINMVSLLSLRLAGNLILAYLLFPKAFGVIALVNIFLRGAEMFSDLGIWRSVTQNERGAEDSFLNTAWTVQVIRGIAMWLVTCALAWPFAELYEEPMLAQYLIAGGFALVLRGFESTSIFLLRRRVAVKELALYELADQIAGVSLMVVWAWISPSIWALVAGNVAGGLVRLIISLTWFREHRPRFQWDPGVARELGRFGKWIFLSSIVTFIAMEGDRLMLGLLVDKATLGMYGIGLAYVGMLIEFATRLLSMVVFPILARYQDNPIRMSQMFLQARRHALVCSASACAAIVIAAPVFFEVLYDDRYVSVGYIAQWLACSTWAMILVSGLDLIPLATGNSKVQFVGNLIRSIGVPLGGAGFYFYEIPGLVLGFAAASVLALAFLISRLPHLRTEFWRQSAQVSFWLAAYLGLFFVILGSMGEGITTTARYAISIAMASIPLAVAARVVLVHYRK